MSLSNDICRCLDSTCPLRNECLRWLERDTGDERTPRAATMWDAMGLVCWQFWPAEEVPK